MSEWPTIAEHELLERLAMSDAEFEAFLAALTREMPRRAYEAGLFERALGYPWPRPAGPFLLTGAKLEPLADRTAGERRRIVARFASAGERWPMLAIGSNAAPHVLERKFAHLPDEADRSVLAVTGRLHDFDVGASAHLALYGAMPATLFPSAGTAVCATVLWLTAAQLSQLAWSEINYRLGSLRARFEADGGSASFDKILAFVSRFGSFCLGGRPTALAAIPATGRTAPALTQEQLLDAAARVAIGPAASAEELVRAVFEEPGRIVPRISATLCKASRPFSSDRWTPFGRDGRGTGTALV